MAGTPLPFPQILDTDVGTCLRCAYDLSGLPDAEVCPECGLRIGPVSTIGLVGVPRRTERHLWRRLVWGVLIVFGIGFSQTWAMFAFSGHFGTVVILFVVLLAACILMWRTGVTRSRAVERVLFTWGGIARSEWRRRDAPTELMEWPEQMYVRTRSVGTVWQKLTIEDHGQGVRERNYFECGFRCRREDLEWVKDCILAVSRGEAVTGSHVPDPPAPESS